MTRDKQPMFDLIKNWTMTLPTLRPTEVPIAELVKLLLRLTIHIDPEIGKESYDAVVRFASHLDCEDEQA